MLLSVDSTMESLWPQIIDMGKANSRLKFMMDCQDDATELGFLAGRMRALSEELPGRVLLSIQCDQLLSTRNNQPTPTGAATSYGRIAEFLAMVRAICKPRPELFLAGSSAEAVALTIKLGDCLWQAPKNVGRVHSDALPILHMGKEVGLRLALIGRASAEEACAAAAVFLPRAAKESLDRAVESGPWLWSEVAGEGRSCGRSALVGSFEQLATALMRYREKGISQFLLNDSADGRELIYFCEGVLPLVLKRERELSN